ncbi:hypothetical protein MKW98_010690 [Papaver atlanticum]|uniref:Uncharacterized protein n=1 Tax=Papaver atlanticum TaxID=357466 RepID=A0AAD4SI83_9MAGN|nr:hypothetical protein MKW98_010690 [Papaver atlanticum]
MRHIISSIRRNFKNLRKSSRVGDENMIRNGNIVEVPMFDNEVDRRRHHHQLNGLSSILYGIIKAPFAILSGAVSHYPQANGVDGAWAMSGEFGRMSEMNNLMINDSMRYAIYM